MIDGHILYSVGIISHIPNFAPSPVVIGLEVLDLMRSVEESLGKYIKYKSLILHKSSSFKWKGLLVYPKFIQNVKLCVCPYILYVNT